MGELRVGTLCDVAVMEQQIAGTSVAELRIGVKEVDEIREASVKTAIGDHLIHFGANLLHLLEAYLVDPLGREGGSRVPCDEIFVEVRAAGQSADGNGVAAMRDVAVHQKIVQFS